MGNKNQGGTNIQGEINQGQINIFEHKGTAFQKPITFQEFGPTSESKESQKLKVGSSSVVNRQTHLQPGLSVGGSGMKSSRFIDSKIDKDRLTVINEYGQRVSQVRDEKEMEVPFSVVKITIDQNVKQTITQLKSQFFQKHQNSNSSLYQWKINRKGDYYKQLGKSRIAIIKPGSVYEGGYLEKEPNIYPHDFGTLFTGVGMYVGHFSSGEAHGQGVYTNRIEKSRFQGEWVNGEMVKGSIDNTFYHFEGTFEANIAQGKGSITFRKQNCTYTGGFQDGLYEDDNGYFESTIYDYSGGFKEGKKEGIGCLIEKQRYSKYKNKRYKPQQEFQGYFRNDVYQGKQKQSKNLSTNQNLEEKRD